MSLLGQLVSRAALRRLVLPLVATLIALPLVRGLRGYTWSQALISASAIGALSYVTRRTFEQIRVRAPRPEDHSPDQQAVDPASGNPADQEKKEP